MNIIFTPQSYKEFSEERRKANKGCYICPCCGEWRQAFIYDMLGKNLPMCRTGIEVRTERRHINNSFASVDCFFCNNCKAQWESEPFDFDDTWQDEGDIWYAGDRLDDGDDLIYIGEDDY